MLRGMAILAALGWPWHPKDIGSIGRHIGCSYQYIRSFTSLPSIIQTKSSSFSRTPKLMFSVALNQSSVSFDRLFLHIDTTQTNELPTNSHPHPLQPRSALPLAALYSSLRRSLESRSLVRICACRKQVRHARSAAFLF